MAADTSFDGIIITIIKTTDKTIKTNLFEIVLPLARVMSLFIIIPPLIYRTHIHYTKYVKYCNKRKGLSTNTLLFCFFFLKSIALKHVSILKRIF
ncbi:hypothetical protein FORC10_0339 [Bacillus cereus]|nr:hypothetical protein FORC48_3446 [Bacillus cereus]AVR33274.1 hypothetical protein FORC60_3442 [Bacillus cereus]QBZ26499.1 hypothetical protein FORC085_3444 [Bacillus cereus]UWJ16428.1 hypothetical protein FORC10_0339 [Bacillus cereus]